MKLITSSNADGEEAPLFFVVKCKEKEMSGQSAMELIKIPGLAPGGTTCRGVNQAGYVLFVKKGVTDTDESVEEAIFRFANQYQVEPFINDIRRRVLGWDGKLESLKPQHTAAVSSDGALGQYKFLTSDAYVNWCANNLVIRTKGHASRTSVEQMSDLASKYAHLKKLLKKAMKIYGSALKLRQVNTHTCMHSHVCAHTSCVHPHHSGD